MPDELSAVPSTEGGKAEQNYENEGKGKGFDRVHVKNLPASVDTGGLLALFGEFGVVTAQLKTTDDGTSRCFGNVVLKNEKAARRAAAALNGTVMGNRTIAVIPAGKGKGKAKGTIPDYAQFQQQQEQYAVQMMSYLWEMQASYVQQEQFQAHQTAISTDTEYVGSIKYISEKNGYGFILCTETFKLYEREVFIARDIIPYGAKPRDRVKFTVTVTPKGIPHAKTALFAELPGLEDGEGRSRGKNGGIDGKSGDGRGKDGKSGKGKDGRDGKSKNNNAKGR